MDKPTPPVAAARGLLHEHVSLDQFDLIRVAPSDELAGFVENYWIILWDRTGKPSYRQENLPHPSPHLVIDPQAQTGVFGVQTGKFTYELSGAGRIFGTKFWPGAFRAFVDGPMTDLTNTHVGIGSIFKGDDSVLEQRLMQANDPVGVASDIEAMLLVQKPVLTAKAKQVRQLVELIASNPEITRTDSLAKQTNTSERGLQRLFADYIGVSPKWVIERYRMLEAVDALNNGGDENLTELALRLGYFDQAHFTKAFTALTGKPPSFYQLKE